MEALLQIELPKFIYQLEGKVVSRDSRHQKMLVKNSFAKDYNEASNRVSV